MEQDVMTFLCWAPCFASAVPCDVARWRHVGMPKRNISHASVHWDDDFRYPLWRTRRHVDTLVSCSTSCALNEPAAPWAATVLTPVPMSTVYSLVITTSVWSLWTSGDRQLQLIFNALKVHVHTNASQTNTLVCRLKYYKLWADMYHWMSRTKPINLSTAR